MTKPSKPSNPSPITNHHSSSSPGGRLRTATEEERPLQMVGAINAFCALPAKLAGFRAIYLSGAGVASASFGLPDLGITRLNDVAEDVRRITGATDLPLLVDADPGWGNAFNIARSVRQLTRAGAAGCHIEDQVQAKRCGHRPNKELVEAGADLIFAEAVTNLEDYRRFTGRLRVPVLANLTEFGKKPLFSLEATYAAGIRIVLYPLSAFRAMSAAAEGVYRAIREDGPQKAMIGSMQTREDLYQILNYHEYESKLDSFSEG